MIDSLFYLTTMIFVTTLSEASSVEASTRYTPVATRDPLAFRQFQIACPPKDLV